MGACAVMQDGKYDRLLRLLYDDIEKYETEVDIDTLDTEVLSFVKAMHMTEVLTNSQLKLSNCIG